ncbi:MAG: transcription-repair coupling factor [Rubellimicrobium sp.]|nr:transcription-repair coupling factor [Rubellimicrobium sp.]
MSRSPLHVAVGGAPEGLDARLILSEIAAKGLPVLHVARDDRRLEAMRAALAFFDPTLAVLTFPAWDCLPYDRVSPNPDIAARRMATLAHLAGGAGGRFVLLTTLNAATQRVPARATVAGSAFSARQGERVDESALRAWLVRMGFVQAPTVTEPGDYALRGGILDIFAPGHPAPVRLDFFGDTLDGVRRFDPATQRTTEKLTSIDLAPASEVILDEAAIARFRRTYRIEFGAAGGDDPLYEAVSAGRKQQGMEHWLGFFHDRLETIFDYLPQAVVTLDDRCDAARAARWGQIADQHDARRAAMTQKGRIDSVYKPAAPELLYLDDAGWDAALSGRRVLSLAALPRPTGPGVIDAGGRIGRDFAPERQDEGVNVFAALAAHVRARLKAGPVVLASYSEGARERLAGLLADEGLAGAALVRDFAAVGGGGLHLAVWPLDHGFETRDLTVISEQDVLGDRLIRSARKRRRAEDVLTEAQALTPGDLVVHVEHGVGRYLGLEVITAAGSAHECLALEYAERAKLYLPVENIELLSRYGQEEGALDRLGGGAWQARKARLKERIREMAARLIRVAAERELRRAPEIRPPEEMWEQFLARFPYAETDDQLQAIEDVLSDMGSGTPMDRLICGDVGFGKTEVAIRAAFVAAMSGVQVAIIAPTTLLARQHYQSFAERFRGLPLNLRQLSRFVPAREAEETRAALADGRVDIVIGTHALLARGIRFANLGLLVIDEEQHFGVAHKERLKQLRADVHVLTLTATPIPRTLQMALSGVRALSVIATPPIDRLAIRTYVTEFDTITLREALLREHYRGGQSFFVVPRIADLAGIEDWLRREVPEVSFITAHGQMAAGDLDERMNAFYDGKADVLLSTTIVESGLDIPRANTMIVHRADMFGLAQLYQIRGRVGRSKTRAYAWLTTAPRQKLTAQAERRLRVLGSLDTLGAGFTLASQDLDIRGAGNILGEEQSGHIREVGFELYQQMLQDEIDRLRAGGAAAEMAGEDAWAPQLNLGVPVLIPEDYVPDLDVRLGLYRRLSQLSGKVELEGFAAELIDRFGPLPREVNTLLLVVRIKAMCLRAGISQLDAGPRGATVRFHADRFAAPAGLVDFIQAEKGAAKVRDNRIVLSREWKTEADRIRGAFQIARDLAARVEGTAAPGAKAGAKAGAGAAGTGAGKGKGGKGR